MQVVWNDLCHWPRGADFVIGAAMSWDKEEGMKRRTGRLGCD